MKEKSTHICIKYAIINIISLICMYCFNGNNLNSYETFIWLIPQALFLSVIIDILSATIFKVPVFEVFKKKFLLFLYLNFFSELAIYLASSVYIKEWYIVNKQIHLVTVLLLIAFSVFLHWRVYSSCRKNQHIDDNRMIDVKEFQEQSLNFGFMQKEILHLLIISLIPYMQVFSFEMKSKSAIFVFQVMVVSLSCLLHVKNVDFVRQADDKAFVKIISKRQSNFFFAFILSVIISIILFSDYQSIWRPVTFLMCALLNVLYLVFLVVFTVKYKNNGN